MNSSLVFNRIIFKLCPFNLGYDGKLLALATVQAVYRTCQEWATQLPKLVCANNRPPFSVHAVKNTRRKMEDRHYICVDINTLYGFKVQYWVDLT